MRCKKLKFKVLEIFNNIYNKTEHKQKVYVQVGFPSGQRGRS